MKNNIVMAAASVSFAAVVSCAGQKGDPDGTCTLKDGDVTLTWIQDNAEERLMERTLFPDAPDTLVESLGLQDGIPSTVSVFLAVTPDGMILFDTGLGLPDSRMISSLKALGVEPEDIGYLYLTHFHGDHIGGMVKDGAAVFPEAVVYASREEFDAWMAMPAQKNALVREAMEVYRDRLHFFMPGDTLPCGVLAVGAPGHTPGHTVYRLGQFIVAGDLMHGVALQMGHPEISASYDMDTEEAAQTRKIILEYAADSSLVLAGMHFPAPAFIFPE